MGTVGLVRNLFSRARVVLIRATLTMLDVVHAMGDRVLVIVDQAEVRGAGPPPPLSDF